MNIKFSPMIESVCISKAKIISSQVVNEAVLEDMNENKDIYSEITHFKFGNNGEILSLSSDICKINELKSRVNLLIQKKFSEYNSKEVFISIGTLSGWEIFNGQGPQIPIEVSISGNVDSEFKSNFTNAGINQTLHQIYLYVHMKVNIVMTGVSKSTPSDTNILISENVIVGNVPQACLGMQQNSIAGIQQSNIDKKSN